MRARASHQCVPGSIPGPGVICGLSLLLVLYFAPRGFSPGTPVFPSHQKPTLLNFNSIWKQWMKSHLVRKQIKERKQRKKHNNFTFIIGTWKIGRKKQQQQPYASQMQRVVHLASYFLRFEFLIAISLSHLISLSSKARKTFKLRDSNN